MELALMCVLVVSTVGLAERPGKGDREGRKGDGVREKRGDRDRECDKEGKGGKGDRKRKHHRFGGLDLTEEQKTAAKAIMEPAREEAKKAEDREAGKAIMVAAAKKVFDDVLTDEQRAKVTERRENREERGDDDRKGPHKGRRRRMYLKGLELSDDQKAAVKTIMDAAKAEADKAEGHEAKREIMHAAMKKVVDEVLTDEQKAKLAERKENRGKDGDGEGKGKGRKGGRGSGAKEGEGRRVRPDKPDSDE